MTSSYGIRRVGSKIKREMMGPKSLYRSRAGRHFYRTENVIWAGFGPIGNTEKKKVWADYEQLLWTVFSFFRVQIVF